MTFGDAMRSKARLSITGSTGENGRVMTPEFPKAVHAVPYVRPDMGMNVSLTDLSWLIITFRVPYNGFNRAIFLFVFLSFPPCFFFLELSSSPSGEMAGWVGGLMLHIWCDKDFFALALYSSPNKRLPLGGITSRNTKGRLYFFFPLGRWHHAFLSILIGTDWKLGLDWWQQLLLGIDVQSSWLWVGVGWVGGVIVETTRLFL